MKIMIRDGRATLVNGDMHAVRLNLPLRHFAKNVERRFGQKVANGHYFCLKSEPAGGPLEGKAFGVSLKNFALKALGWIPALHRGGFTPTNR